LILYLRGKSIDWEIEKIAEKIFERKREEVNTRLEKFHSEKVHNAYPSPNIIGAIKSRRTKCAGM
jgi:hypothetical protein